MPPTESANQQDDIATELLSRVKDQLRYYDIVASRAQRQSTRLRLLEVMIASVLPILIVLNIPRSILAGIAISLSVLIALSQVWQFDSKWRQFRFISEQLRRELFMFELQSGEYAELNPSARSRLFAERTQGIIDSEVSKWFASIPREVKSL